MTFVRYVSVQLMAYGIEMVLFIIFFQSGFFGPILSNFFGKLAAGVFAFVLHRHFTFQVVDNPVIRWQAIRYFTLVAFNIFFASVILKLLLGWIDVPVTAKLIADVVCVVLSYALSKHFIFTSLMRSQGEKSTTGARF